METKSEIIKEIKEVIHKHVPDYTFNLEISKNWLGRCNYKNVIIRIKL